MFIIGITGGIGSGKSTLSREFAKWGIRLIDADALSHQVTGKDGSAIPSLVEAFSEGILTDDGALNRSHMASLVFQDKKVLDTLSLIVHEKVFEEIDKILKLAEKQKEKVVVLDVPIPVKKGFLDRSNIVITVSSDDDLRIQRLILRGMTEQDARQRMQMQMSREAYESIGTIVFENNKDYQAVEDFVQQFIKDELETRGIRLKKG